MNGAPAGPDEVVFQAAQRGDLDFFHSLSPESLQRVVTLRDEDSRSVLHAAAAAGHSELVDFLGSKAADCDALVNHADEEGWTPLLSAVSSGHEGVVMALLRLRVDVNKVNVGKRSALHYAASKRRTSLIPILVAQGAKINAKDEVGSTPLHRAASVGDTGTCEVLLEEGANIDARDRMQQTPLMHAVISQHDEVALLLARHGADVHAQDKEENTALSLATNSKLLASLKATANAMDEG